MNITLDKAIEQAEKFTDEETVPFDHWRVVMARLLEEVKRHQVKDLDAIIDAFCADSPLRLAAAGDLEAASEYEKKIESAISEYRDPCRCPACRIAEDVNTIASVDIDDTIPDGNDDGSIAIPPLTAAILADMIDHQADELADLAKEIEIFSISHSHHADELRGAAKQLVGWAKEIREESQAAQDRPGEQDDCTRLSARHDGLLSGGKVI